jgi:hypothetical protein
VLVVAERRRGHPLPPLLRGALQCSGLLVPHRGVELVWRAGQRGGYIMVSGQVRWMEQCGMWWWRCRLVIGSGRVRVRAGVAVMRRGRSCDERG